MGSRGVVDVDLELDLQNRSRIHVKFTGFGCFWQLLAHFWMKNGVLRPVDCHPRSGEGSRGSQKEGLGSAGATCDSWRLAT